MADESSYAARVFPPRPPSSSLMPPRDVLRQGLGEMAQAALRMPGAMLRDWWKWRTAQLTPEAVQESALAGGPIGTGALGGVLRAPLLATKAKYLHRKTGEEPTRVYHGTKHGFGELDVTKSDPHALYGPGLYFTDNPKVATGYAGHPLQVNYDEWVKAGLEAETPRPNVRPAHLDIRNPFDIDSRVAPSEVRRLLTEAGHPIAQTPQNLEGYVKSNLTGEGVYGSLLAHLGSKDAVNTFLQRAGYDGITHRGGRISGGDPHQVWIAFSPEQVISPFEYAAPRAGPR
jgi:hypothetical protein